MVIGSGFYCYFYQLRPKLRLLLSTILTQPERLPLFAPPAPVHLSPAPYHLLHLSWMLRYPTPARSPFNFSSGPWGEKAVSHPLNNSNKTPFRPFKTCFYICSLLRYFQFLLPALRNQYPPTTSFNLFATSLLFIITLIRFWLISYLFATSLLIIIRLAFFALLYYLSYLATSLPLIFSWLYLFAT